MYSKLKKIVKDGSVIKNEYLSKHTSFKVGGKCKYYVVVNDIMQFVDVINYLNNIGCKYYILGGGTNVLANDSGFDGVIISTSGLNQIREYDDYIQVFAGTMLCNLCNYFRINNYTGLEDASGIPGSVGGAVVGNAGAYNFAMSNIVKGVLVLKDGKVKYFNNNQCGFEYRNSMLRDTVVLSVDVEKKSGCDIERINQILSLRKHLPLDKPSAGSVFKRKDNIIVSKLLDQLGYKGKRVGGAMISEKHAGFLINDGGATASDIITLIQIIKTEVEKSTGIQLEEEIQYIN